MKLRWWLDLRNTTTRLKDKVFHQGKQRHRHQFGEITLGKTLFFPLFTLCKMVYVVAAAVTKM